MWDVSYDASDEKYVARTNANVVLDPEKIEWIGSFGLRIYSIEKSDITLRVRFSSGGGY